MAKKYKAHQPKPVPTEVIAKRLLWATGGVSLAGLALSLELTRIHFLTHTDQAYRALCTVNERINCGTVALSPYSVFLGAPVSAWGVSAYFALVVLAAWGLSSRKLHGAWPSGLLFLLSGMACLASVRLAYISLFKINAICLYCNALHLVNAALLALSVLLLEKQRLGAVRAIFDDAGAWKNRVYSTWSFSALGLSAAVCMILFWPHYWENPDWRRYSGLSTGVTDRGEQWIGAKSPAATIVEFTDYECPICRREHQKIRAILFKHGDRLRLVQKHFPLDHQCNSIVNRPFHLHACELSAFTSCAGLQGRFWPANDALITALEISRPENLNLERIAERAGLDVAQLQACLAAGAGAKAVQADIEEGIRLKVRGTPTFFIDGKCYEGTIPLDVLTKLLLGTEHSP